MLRNLHVKNLALVEEADIDFKPGLNILTGETGAGKSILLGSIQLALGAKMPKDLLRNPEKPGIVELVFDVEDEKITEALEEYDIYPEDGQVVLSRRIRDGKSTVKINGETVSMSVCRDISSLLMDIHGQHEHQSLLLVAKHQEILDAFGKGQLKEAKGTTKRAYEIWKHMEKEYASYDMDEEKRLRELDLCKYEIEEITNAALREGEEEELEVLYKKCSNARKIAEGLAEICQELGNDVTGGASEAIGRAMRTCGQIIAYDDGLENIYSQLSDLDAICSGILREAEDYIEEMSFNEEKTLEIERRLDAIYRLKGKYGNSIEKILAYLEERKVLCEKLENYEVDKKKAAEALKRAETSYFAEAEQLSALRKVVAKELEQGIVAALTDLNFLEVKFTISIAPSAHPGKDGIDAIEFLISTNPGEPVRPLAKIASGGELSRIMLAIKTIMAEIDSIDTLLFDEIDTGISGRTAQMVAEKMSYVASRHQVLCITHLPQIAAMADHHFYIEKQVEQEKTVTKISELSEKDSILELARMLGGVEITDSVIENAREMKTLAQAKKVK
ncbi:MAG: DNA repair protein RecN [Lachnospiraceae bacterium]|nr:DNA repair protein RecN [Lachnospiraceae bacterium]